ncbi:MAG: hypothetical protein F6K14_11325 [Symploca sp. SIO2C1]|nr:hypothetical protein [Symploca sp. SIO2C1]
MKELEPLENRDLKRLKLFIYLVPIIGTLPALWSLYRRQGTREQQSVSRLSVTLAFSWLLSYFLLSAGSQVSEFWSIRLLLMNTMFTSGYFLVTIWLMVRLWQGKSPRLPWVSRIAEGSVRKHLS